MKKYLKSKHLYSIAVGVPLLAVALFGVASGFTNSLANPGMGYGGNGYGGYGGNFNTPTNYKHTFKGNLLGSNEVGPVTTQTTGNGIFDIGPTENFVDYAIFINNGTGITGANLACAPAGKNGIVVANLFSSGAQNVNGLLTSGTLTVNDLLQAAWNCSPNIHTLPHLVQAMREGQIYVNVLSSQNPGGEVRGQLAWQGTTDAFPPTGQMDNNNNNNNNDQIDNDNDGNDPADNNNGNPPPVNQNTNGFLILSNYYVLPGQYFYASGHNFNPNEHVTVTFAGMSKNMVADGGGNFVTDNFLVPFSAINSTQQVHAAGNMGNTTNQNETVGTFYPVVSPSGYYFSAGQTVSFNGSGFAPNEMVNITRGGSAVASPTANGSGGFGTAGFTVPGGASSQTYTFTGAMSHVSVSVTINVAP